MRTEGFGVHGARSTASGRRSARRSWRARSDGSVRDIDRSERVIHATVPSRVMVGPPGTLLGMSVLAGERLACGGYPLGPPNKGAVRGSGRAGERNADPRTA
ncbi:hypothetical protein GCM10027521_39620 [Amycolatopsis cihanbeyliensis]